MEWQEKRIVNCFQIERMFCLLFLAVLFLFSVNCWSACELKQEFNLRFTVSVGCKNGTTSCNSDLIYSIGCNQNCSSVTLGHSSSGNKVCVPRSVSGISCDVFGNGIVSEVGRIYYYQCGTACEADSIRCITDGKTWLSASSGESCGHCVDETVCDTDRARCEAADGVFNGSVNNGCCIATCNQCGKLSDLIEQKAQICCSRGQAPPDTSRQCRVEARSTCGMNWSTVVSNDNEFACRDPSGSANASAAYASCFLSSSSAGSSSSSSGEGGSSSSGFGDCLECPYLDSILDTLTAQKGIVSDIYRCVSVPTLCSNPPEEEKPFQFDTAWNYYIRPFLDTSLRLDSQQLKVLRQLDTNQLKLLESYNEQLRNDTLIRLAVSGGFSQTQDAISQARGSIVHLNDTTRKWLDRISSKIGITTDSLISHIDSVRKEIPVQVLDSILKYQKQLAEKDDSLVLDDLPLIDSLIDSTVRYWRMSIENDSVRRLEGNDSLQALHDAIDAVALRMSYLLGYGDTASSDLRKDLFSMNDTVKAHFDSIAARLGVSTDSLIAHIDGLNGLSMDSLRVDLNGFSESFRTYRDSVIKYFGSFVSADSSYNVTFKDSVESVHGTLNEIKDSLTSLKSEFEKGSYDTNSTYDSYLSGHDTAAVNFINNAAAAMGGALASSAYDGIFDLSSNSSAVSSGDYALMNLDSANAVMRASNDSMKSALADTMQTWFDELRKDFVLVNFDSAIIAPLGAKVPNTNTCPESCFAIDLSAAGGIFSGMHAMNWGLCKPIVGSLNVFEFIRLILRIVTALTCVYIGMWFISGKSK